MNKYEKDYKHYGLGIEEQTTREHPWGKGATGRFTPKEMVLPAALGACSGAGWNKKG